MPLLALMLWSCAAHNPVEGPDLSPVPDRVREAPDATNAVLQAALDQAEDAARWLAGVLKGRLVGAMAEGGPASAADLCSTEAHAITDGANQRGDARVGRSSLRLRNPNNAGPDWVQAWLITQGERPAAGVEPVRRIDTVAGVQLARVIIPLAVEAPCLACHGVKSALDPDVTLALVQRYPEDQATGYALGDLRGALWAEVPVAPAADPDPGGG